MQDNNLMFPASSVLSFASLSTPTEYIWIIFPDHFGQTEIRVDQVIKDQ